MTDWVRRSFDSLGPTQSPPGRHLDRLQDRYMGKVLLCLDVSGSMLEYDGTRQTRLQRAVAGARRFVDEAVTAHYQVGLILWDHGVHQFVPIAVEPDATLRALAKARIAGGTALTPALRRGIRDLRGRPGDRVLAIFSDGELADERQAEEAARDAAGHGIRILARGLGRDAARCLERITTEGRGGEIEVSTPADIEASIAGMATGMVARARRLFGS